MIYPESGRIAFARKLPGGDTINLLQILRQRVVYAFVGLDRRFSAAYEARLRDVFVWRAANAATMDETATDVVKKELTLEYHGY